jgi:hypothetical protein
MVAVRVRSPWPAVATTLSISTSSLKASVRFSSAPKIL